MSINKPYYLRVGNQAISLDAIASIDANDIEELRLHILLHNGDRYTVLDNEAIDAVMMLKPSLLEGRRLQWAKRAWMYHNLVAHPLMQFFAFFGKYKRAMEIHDATIPRPLGRRGCSSKV